MRSQSYFQTELTTGIRSVLRHRTELKSHAWLDRPYLIVKSLTLAAKWPVNRIATFPFFSRWPFPTLFDFFVFCFMSSQHLDMEFFRVSLLPSKKEFPIHWIFHSSWRVLRNVCRCPINWDLTFHQLSAFLFPRSLNPSLWRRRSREGGWSRSY